MSILSGFFKTKRYRKTPEGYKLQSEWTSSQTLQMDDGNTAQTNLGAIKGITTSLNVSETGYALDAKVGKQLNESLDGIDPAFSKSLPTRNQYKDFLQINPNDRNDPAHKVMYFGADSPGVVFVNSPVTDTPFYGYRTVRWNSPVGVNGHLITVELHEQYPVAGRVWANTYDKGNSQWYGWRCETETLKKSVSDGKKTVAAVITAKGVPTAADASFSTIAANIQTLATNNSLAFAGFYGVQNYINSFDRYITCSLYSSNCYTLETNKNTIVIKEGMYITFLYGGNAFDTSVYIEVWINGTNYNRLNIEPGISKLTTYRVWCAAGTRIAFHIHKNSSSGYSTVGLFGVACQL